MDKNKNKIGPDFFERLWEESWTYIKTVVDVVREPVLILDKNFKVMAANEPFYRMFQVTQKETEGKIVYELGNGQWNIASLRKLLEDILPKHTFFKGFEVAHEFPVIGSRVMILNARQIHSRFVTGVGSGDSELFPPIILLAMEDITEMIAVAEQLAGHVNQFESKHSARTQKLEISITELKKQIEELKVKVAAK
ncbi:MAG: PAS domain-containing protein [Patescibacteria group bacterium]